MRKIGHIRSTTTAVCCACPSCGAALNGFTAVKVGGLIQRPLLLKGKTTMCCHCGAVLVFADNRGNVRAMTISERAAYKPNPMLEKIRRSFDLAEDFTKKRYN